jgi:hypothetical protein
LLCSTFEEYIESVGFNLMKNKRVESLINKIVENKLNSLSQFDRSESVKVRIQIFKSYIQLLGG